MQCKIQNSHNFKYIIKTFKNFKRSKNIKIDLNVL
jgi:hypothetical protein